MAISAVGCPLSFEKSCYRRYIAASAHSSLMDGLTGSLIHQFPRIITVSDLRKSTVILLCTQAPKAHILKQFPLADVFIRHRKARRKDEVGFLQ